MSTFFKPRARHIRMNQNEVTPEQSRERLKRFLDLLASWEPETPDIT